LIDEHSIDNVHFDSIKDYLKLNIGTEQRAGWYYQQFLKMQAFKIIENQYYLIWDADTIPLQKIIFFNKNNQILIQTGSEHHLPYFETIHNILGINKQVPYSFISEHMMVDRKQMEKFIIDIQTLSSNQNWPLFILTKINKSDLALSGFSEYESFGNYLIQQQASYFETRKEETLLKTYRFGSQLFGKIPSDNDLQLLTKMGYSYVTFEEWDIQKAKVIQRNKRLANIVNKITNYESLSFIEKKIISKIKKQIIS